MVAEHAANLARTIPHLDNCNVLARVAWAISLARGTTAIFHAARIPCVIDDVASH